jgi:hypothetical protein
LGLKNPQFYVEEVRKKINASEKLRDFDYLLLKFKEIEIIKHLLLNNQQYLAIEFLKLDDDQTQILHNISCSLEQKEKKMKRSLIILFLFCLKIL